MGNELKTIEASVPGGAAGQAADASGLLVACGGTFDPLVKALRIGLVRGLAGIIGQGWDHDHVVALARELVRQDVLVLVAANAAPGLETAGGLEDSVAEAVGAGLGDFCDHLGLAPVVRLDGDGEAAPILWSCAWLAEALGVAGEALPVVVCAPQGPSGQAAGIGLHEAAAAAGCEPRCRLGEAYGVEADPAGAAAAIGRRITARRLALGLNDRYDGTVYS
ncbi:MAG: hypothetical protein ACP59X_20265 [Solidesulfovibrio sp. DCME]|uniref:hypothetical protein n=1 Tax=Solidesulfovibrio sp. DCME TaxID=3447380 RepID=UPI003D09C3F8